MSKKEIPSIIEEGPLAGASIPLNLWMQINDIPEQELTVDGTPKETKTTNERSTESQPSQG